MLILSGLSVPICCNMGMPRHEAQLSGGRILTENSTPATGSTVVLLRYKDSSVVNSVGVDKDGAFQFAEINPGSYLLLVSKVGYNKSYSRSTLPNNKRYQSVTTAVIILEPADTQLKGSGVDC